jgi:hypothetical protein
MILQSNKPWVHWKHFTVIISLDVKIDAVENFNEVEGQDKYWSGKYPTWQAANPAIGSTLHALTTCFSTPLIT